MTLFKHLRISNIKIIFLFSVIIVVLLFISNYSHFCQSSISSSNFFLSKINKLCPRSYHSPSPYPFPKILFNLTFSSKIVYHHDGIAYDYYSKYDLGQSNARYQWRIWPLPNEINPASSFNATQISPFVISKLPFVDVIYLMTDPRLKERHTNLKKAFDRQGISMDSVKWRMKWNSTTCYSNSTHSYVYQRMNLNNKPLNAEQQRRCALAMKHVDVWYEMAEQNIGLGLIIEDDAIFVPFFKEKLTRMISAAINERILRINQSCIHTKEKPISNDERIDQNPMFVIGTCFHFHGQHFQSDLLNPLPVLSTHKLDPTRCTHAYLLTSCSAEALVKQIEMQKNDFWPSDFFQNYLFRLSRTLQSFWVDPPLSYQGNQVIDLDHLETFKRQTY